MVVMEFVIVHWEHRWLIKERWNYMKEIRDCRYCEYATTGSPDCNWCNCYVDDGYFDHKVTDFKEAENCDWFEFCDIFPKY